MNPRLVLASFFSLSVSAFSMDPAFKLLKQDEKVNVYSRQDHDCEEAGADVLFVLENKTKERLELKIELLNLKIKNKLTVLIEPSSNTSILNLSPDTPMCGVEMVDMKVNSLTFPGIQDKAPTPATATVSRESTL